MKKLYIDRLNKIANHLNYGKLGHKRQVFNELHVEFEEDEKRKKQNKGFCGSLGCAMGEFPIIFPRYFHFFGKKIYLRREITYNLEHCIMEFLNIDYNEYNHLFFPSHQLIKYGGEFLDGLATKEQVADNILDFIKYKQRKERNEKVIYGQT